jgi:hypothetical protein
METMKLSSIVCVLVMFLGSDMTLAGREMSSSGVTGSPVRLPDPGTRMRINPQPKQPGAYEMHPINQGTKGDEGSEKPMVPGTKEGFNPQPEPPGHVQEIIMQ